MNEKIERLFRVPYRRLELIKQDINKKKYRFIHEFSKDSLFEGIEQANSALEKAKSDFEIAIKHGEVSPDLLSEFKKAYSEYYAESRKVKDLVYFRESAVTGFLSSMASTHSVKAR